ncbi:hypothetical protein F4826_004674 [Rahnella inusitata]|jgi:hypothetical protein|nr:hypothetical protein [Rahnella inusitata]RKT89513.1 hypothetical protein BJ925_0224 [Rahnella aquatilis]
MEKINGMTCSTAHITPGDGEILSQYVCEKFPWVFDTGYGYLLMLREYRYPVLKLKEMGISKPVRKLVLCMRKQHQIGMICFDPDADTLDGYDVFEW